jgi:hypothetical protein
MDSQSCNYRLDGIKEGFKGLENTCMVNNHSQYQNNGKQFFPNLQISIETSMENNHHEEDDRENPEVGLAQLKQRIATLKKLLT